MSVGVFISYRRAPAAFIARAVYQDLHMHGYDAFLDVQSIDSGTFTVIIDRQIRSRKYFVLILTPETLNRCQQVDDMVRREITVAFESKRVIIPFATDTFDWGDITRYLPPELHGIGMFNSVPKVSHEWFEAAMERLRTRHLRPPEYEESDDVPTLEPQEREASAGAAPQPTVDLTDGYTEARSRARSEQNTKSDEVSKSDAAFEVPPPPAPMPAPIPAARPPKPIAPLSAVAGLPPVTPNEMAAESLVLRAASLRQHGDLADALPLLDQAISLMPDYASAWLQRGLVKLAQNDDAASITDFEQAILLNDTLADAYGGIAMAYMSLGKLSDALPPVLEGLAIAPNDAGLLFLRAHLHQMSGEAKAGISTLQRVVELNPDYPTAANKLDEWKKARGWRGWFD